MKRTLVTPGVTEGVNARRALRGLAKENGSIVVGRMLGESISGINLDVCMTMQQFGYLQGILYKLAQGQRKEDLSLVEQQRISMELVTMINGFNHDCNDCITEGCDLRPETASPVDFLKKHKKII